MFKRADLVFVTSEKLRQRAAQFSARVHLFPFAVNLAVFQKSREAGRAGAGGPRGAAAADRRLRRRPASVGRSGPARRGRRRACRTIDVRAGRARADRRLAVEGAARTCTCSASARTPSCRATSRGFDVGLVPYRITEYTANVYPTKLNEYLVMGIPVVATDLAEIRRFNAEHGDIVRIAESADAYADAVTRSDRCHRCRRRRRCRAASRSPNRTAGSAGSKRCPR